MKLITLATLGCLGAAASGCIVDTATPTPVVLRNAYEPCNAGDACTNGTACSAAMYSLTGRPGNLCTVTCTDGAQCPPSAYFSAFAPTCIVSATAGLGLCYDSCLTSGDCGAGTVCAMVPGTIVRVCVPAT